MRVLGDKFISVATLVCVSILSATVADLGSSTLVGEFYLGTFAATGFFFSQKLRGGDNLCTSNCCLGVCPVCFCCFFYCCTSYSAVCLSGFIDLSGIFWGDVRLCSEEFGFVDYIGKVGEVTGSGMMYQGWGGTSIYEARLEFAMRAPGPCSSLATTNDFAFVEEDCDCLG